MQFTTIGLGALIVIFSVYTLYLSINKADKQIRLVYMQSKLGSFLGTFLHSLVYVLIPTIFASFMINAGLDGITITSFITE